MPLGYKGTANLVYLLLVTTLITVFPYHFSLNFCNTANIINQHKNLQWFCEQNKTAVMKTFFFHTTQHVFLLKLKPSLSTV